MHEPYVPNLRFFWVRILGAHVSWKRVNVEPCFNPCYIGIFNRTAILTNLTQQIAGGVMFDIEVILPEMKRFTSRSALTLQLYYRGSSLHPSLDTSIHSCIALQESKDLMKKKKILSLIYCSPSSRTWKIGLCSKSLAMSTRYPI